MPFVAKQTVAKLLIAVALAPVDLGAQTIPPTNANQGAGDSTPANGASQFTGKERLGEKWKDQQRIDNCKVPFDKRGTKPRPDGCAHVPPG